MLSAYVNSEDAIYDHFINSALLPLSKQLQNGN